MYYYSELHSRDDVSRGIGRKDQIRLCLATRLKLAVSLILNGSLKISIN